MGSTPAESPGGPVVRTQCFQSCGWVLPLVWEQRSHMKPLHALQDSCPTRFHSPKGPGASDRGGVFEQQGQDIMGWQGQPRKTPWRKQILRKAGKESTVAAPRSTWGKSRAGGQQDGHTTPLAPQPPKAATYTLVMIVKWAYVDSQRDTLAGLKSVSLTAGVSSACTAPSGGGRGHSLFRGATEMLCAQHAVRCALQHWSWSYSGEQNRGQKTLHSWGVPIVA